MGNVERKVIDSREAERRDITARRKSDDKFRFVFTGAGDVTGATATMRIYTKPGGTLENTIVGVLSLAAGPDPKATFDLTAVIKQGLSKDNAGDTEFYFYEVELSLPTTTIWFNGDLTVNP